MNIVFYTFALLIPPIMGFFLVSCCWSYRENSIALFVCKCSLAVGIGFGLSSFTSFLTLLVAGTANILLTFFFELLFISLFGMILRYKRIPLLPSFSREPHTRSTSFSEGLAWTFSISLLLFISIFVLRSLENPYGEPDAWTFWNSRARLYFRTGEEWRYIFSSGDWSFPKYPQLIPMNIVRVWSAYGQEFLAGSIMFAFLFTLGTLVLLTAALAYLRGRSQGYLGGLVLASTPYFLKHGASQYADVPFGCYVLMTLILITMYDETPQGSSGLLVLAGVTAGFAAWTKEEGWLLLATILIARGIVLFLLKGGVRRSRHEIMTFFSGYAPIFLVMLFFRLFIAPPSISFSRQFTLFELLTEPSRYLITAKAFLRIILEPYSLVLSVPIIVLFVYSMFLGIDASQIKKPGILTTFLILGGMLSGYFFVYITTAQELTWLIATTLNRLFLQLWPGMIFLAFLLIKTPENRWSGHS